MTSYRESLNLLQSRHPALATQLEKLPNLEAVLRWAPSLTGVDSVQQDEYNYDILVPHGESEWLSFGVT